MTPTLKRKSLGCLMSVVGVFFLVSCGPLPQPFQGTPSVSSANPLLDIPTAVGIAVLPIEGAPAPFGDQLTAAVADHLRRLEIPAEAVPNNAGLGFSLKGRVDAIERRGDSVAATLTWTLESRRGDVAGSAPHTFDISEDAWRDGDAGVAALYGRDPARSTLAMLGGDVAPAPPPPAAPAASTILPSVSVLPVEGAPGDGREALMLAVLQSLSLNGAARDDINPDVTLHCEVFITPHNDQLQRVEIVWRAQLRTGAELGTMTLDNTIPIGALNGTWGATAFAIADAAAPDLLKLLALAQDTAGPANP